MESTPDIDRIAKEATLIGLEESIKRYMERIEELSTHYRILANELYPPEDEHEEGEPGVCEDDCPVHHPRAKQEAT